MVGVLTSNRCANCRKRKKKCDEKQPSCTQCIKGGWVCPGYPTTWKFVDEAPRLADHYAGRKYIYDPINSRLESAYSRCLERKTNHDDWVMGWENVQSNDTPMKLEVPRFLNLNPLGSALVYCLDCKVKGDLMPLPLFGSFFGLIPARLGHNLALDDAVACLCSIYSYTPSTPYKFNEKVYQSYVKALSSLRAYLNDESARMEPETLCASILLQMSELVVNIDSGEWSHLARGTSTLFSSRGIQRYQTAFEQAMLHSQLSYIIGQSMKFREDCFLRSSEWQTLLAESSDWLLESPHSTTLMLKSQMCAILVKMPGLLEQHSKLAARSFNQSDWEEQTDMFTQNAFTILRDFQKWLRVQAEPHFLRSPLPMSLSTQQNIEYPDIIFGVLDCVANTAIITIHKILRSVYHTRSQQGSSGQPAGQQWMEIGAMLEDPDTIERRCQRAVSAFHFVQAQSKLAAKPLGFGIQQIQSGNSNSAAGSSKNN
ncbi:hypothetical protein G7Y89_g4828 [Cudoniella acicularis]|uniref:Zn(2)-C6 fungal-type domain-containing protein n=1 Tax=Cudoniella acicularis TaxID=354080 RepID=A0A8H4W4C1_9HELO|nr:hypothetical protein G7Y89_g4828 [Cudoniella acicularis]